MAIETLRKVSESEGEGSLSLKTFRSKDGLMIKVKSEIIEKFVKELFSPSGTVEKPLWGKTHKFWKIPSTMNQIDSRVHLNYFSNDLSMAAHGLSGVNLTFLRAVGLSEGVKFQLSGPFSNQMVDDFCKEVDNGVKLFYENFMKSYGVEYEWIVREKKEAA